MSFNEFNLFESVIHFTEERDKRSLEKALIQTLADFITFDTIILLRIPRHFDNDYLEVAVSLPESAVLNKLKLVPHEYGDQLVESDESITFCIEKTEVISDKKSATQRMLFPIVVNNIVTGILDLYGHETSENSDKLIQGFIRIFSNFQAIINDNEHDTLTGLLNRKTFDAQFSELVSKSSMELNDLACTGKERRISTTDTHHWVGILDIDHFKSINDNFGHMYGDEVLLLFANLMNKTFRSCDLLFRYGGEEFVVVLAPATESDAFMAFERFRKTLEVFDFPQVGRVTVSTGLTKIHAQEHSAAVLGYADRALYYAKEHGRNQVCNYHDLLKEGLVKKTEIKDNIELF